MIEKLLRHKKAIIITLSVIVSILTIGGIVMYTKRTGFYKKNGETYYFNNGRVMTDQWIERKNGVYYAGNDGRLVTGLQDIDGKSYFFSDKGVMITGFVEFGNQKRYYDKLNGVMITGYKEIEGANYYFDAEGYMQTGKVEINGEAYLFDDDGRLTNGLIRKGEDEYFTNPDGSLFIGLKKMPDGKIYLFGEDGRSQYGFFDYEGKRYYLYKTHKLAVGKCKVDDKFYGFDENGAMMKGFMTIDGKLYYAREDGALIRNCYEIIDGKTYKFGNDYDIQTGWIVLSDGKRGYALEDGSICMNTVKNIENNLYYFSSTGAVGEKGFVKYGNKTYYVTGVEGKLQTGKAAIAGDTYFFEEDGSMLTGWIKDGDRDCYAGEDGRLFKGEKTFDNFLCKFDSDGYLVEKKILYYKYVALTYDDGPSIHTPKLLDVLEKTGAKCTFFIVGNRAGTYAETIKRADALGCEIGSHTYEHAYLTRISKDDIKYQINSTDEAVNKIIGKNCPVFRPPGGYIDSSTASIVNKPCYMWSLDTIDWKTRDKEQTIKNVLSKVKDGDIILMHDLYESTTSAAETIITSLQEQGYKCVTVSELAKIRGGQVAGKVYYNYRKK